MNEFPVKLPPYLKQSVPPFSGPTFTAIRYPGEEGIVHVTGIGTNKTAGFLTMFYIGAELIYPPALHFSNVPPSGIVLQVITPFKCEFAYQHPNNVPGIPEPGDTITVHTVSGPVVVPIQEASVTPQSGDGRPWPWKVQT